MENRLVIALWILMGIYIVYKLFFSRKAKQRVGIGKYTDKLDEVLKSEKYKIKGQYD